MEGDKAVVVGRAGDTDAVVVGRSLMEAMGMETKKVRWAEGGWRHSRLLEIEIHQRNGRRVLPPEPDGRQGSIAGG